MIINTNKLKFKYRKKSRAVKEYWSHSDAIFRTSFSVLLTAIFIILFFLCGGNLYFTGTRAVSEFQAYQFEVHAIDVGQGDCTLIKFPNNQTMLIDAGNIDEGKKVTAYIKSFFKIHNLDRLDYLVLTHSDADHIGGAIDVLSNIEVDTVYRPNVYTQEEADDLIDNDVFVTNTLTYQTIIALIKEKDCQVIFTEQGEQLNLGGAEVEFLSPHSQTNYTDSNSYSAVIMITCLNKKFLFMGDAGIDIENTLIAEYGSYLDADVLKVGHHGSDTSSSEEFLKLVSPSYSLLYISSNKDFPSQAVLSNLRELGSQVYSTYSEGDFAMTVSNDEIIVAHLLQPSFDIALLISIYVLLLLLTWGIKNRYNYGKKRRVKIIALQD